jgi:hypothetical protein
MATTQHYLWASGHFILLVSAIRYFLAALTFKTVSTWWYKASFTGALLSYAIVCHKQFGMPQPNLAYIRRALLDENIQYFALAFFWWSSRPVTLALVPYMIFSLFHALTFTRTTLMTQFLPPTPPATSGGQPQPHPIAKRLQQWVKANYDRAMKIVAYAELLLLVRVVLGIFTFSNSLLTPIFYAHFLRQRYYQSTFTRSAVGTGTAKLDQIVNRPGNPPVLVSVWGNIKALVARWAGQTLEQQPAGAVPRRD